MHGRRDGRHVLFNTLLALATVRLLEYLAYHIQGVARIDEPNTRWRVNEQRSCFVMQFAVDLENERDIECTTHMEDVLIGDSPSWCRALG